MVMEVSGTTKVSHKAWRRLAKKERRRRLRRKAAAEREADEERLRAALESTAEYLNWKEKCEAEDREREIREKAEHDEREKLWLEEEVRAQKEWQVLQERRLKARQQQLEQEAKIREEFEAKRKAIRAKQEEEKRKREEEMKRREELLKEIDDYIDSGIKTPETLREVIDSQPGKELCPFFTKTGACRYGDTCSRNHRRVCLSKVILVPGFYSHFSLEKNSAEYDTDIGLEFESSETRQHFREFYKDVVPELESFGKIKTLKYCCNTEIHLRGNLYVEYYTEREAARALRSLKGRWYAGKQLNCEFANLKSWRSAVCGMAKCPKGRACNFLHTFKNPHDEYDVKSPPRRTKQSGISHEGTSSRRSEHRSKSKWEEDYVANGAEDNKNWRWSESPEVEVEHRSRTSERRRERPDERNHRQKSTRDKRYDQSDRDNITDNTQLSSNRRRSNSRRHFEDNAKDDGEVTNGRESSKTHSNKSRRMREEASDHDDSTSSKRARRNCSTNDMEKKYRSKTQKHSQHSSRKHTAERERRKKHRNHTEIPEDCSSRRKSARSSEKLSVDKSNEARNVGRVKSKWDKEESDQSSTENTGSTDSDSSSAVDDRREELKILPKTSTERLDDEWATTDSENEAKSKKG